MLPAQYYHPIYLIIITILSIYCIVKNDERNSNNTIETYNEPQIPSIVLCVFMMLFIGTRPISKRYFVDMGDVANLWFWWSQGDVYSFRWSYENKIYDNIRAFMATYNMPVEYFFLLISIIYFGCMYISCKKLFPKDTLFSFVVYLTAFSTFSYGVNGFKAGSAASLFLVAIAYYENYKIMIPMILLSWGFHHSMVMVVGSFICVYFFKKTKYYFIIWAIAFIIAVFHIDFFQMIFAKLADERGAGYLQGQIHGKGFRLDFIAYSFIPILIGYYAIFKLNINSEKYKILLNLYLLTNSIWMLCMYAEFTNRIAYLSWFLHPWVMIYPFLNEKITKNQYSIVNYIACGHLFFTLFLNIIYWR